MYKLDSLPQDIFPILPALFLPMCCKYAYDVCNKFQIMLSSGSVINQCDMHMVHLEGTSDHARITRQY